MLTKFRVIIAVFGLMLTVTVAVAQDEVKINSTEVAKNIHMLTGQGGNIGVFTGADGTFIVDDQFAPLSEKILQAIKSIGGDTPKFLLNTHFHGDHTGGNENFGKKGTLIVSHDNVRKRLADGSFIAAFGMKAPPASKAALPAITFSDDMHFHINGDSVRAVHVANAHTDGDSFIHFGKANVVHAGDIFFNGFYPFIDATHGGSVRGVINAVDTILSLSNNSTKIIPGHGPLADKAQLQAYRDMLSTAYERLLKLKNSGVSVDDAIAKAPLADLEAKWGGVMFNSDKWIKIIYPGVY